MQPVQDTGVAMTDKHEFAKKLRSEMDSQFLMEERDKLLETLNWLQAQFNSTLHALQQFTMNYNVLVQTHVAKKDAEKEEAVDGSPPSP